jgi:SAM-dependent methyltransferase
MTNVRKIAAFVEPYVPRTIWQSMRTACHAWRKVRYRLWGRPEKPGETSKARRRRAREAFFERYCNGRGLDVGYGGDLLTTDCRGWDFEHGNAQYLKPIGDSEFDFVYSSHTLEHMTEPETALRNWWRVLKSGGYLILYLPHRELYEKKRTLPSHWNIDHKHFFLLDKDEEPDTIGIIPMIHRSLSDFEILCAKECSEGHTLTSPEIHSDGEYSIEVVVKKK